MAKHGICHIEWSSTNLKRTQTFFGGLFSWKFEPWGEDYVLFKAPGMDGGFMKVDKVRPGQSPTVYVEVHEFESYLKKAKELGGGIAVPKTEIPTVGWFAHVTDPDGNMVGLFQGNPK